MTSFQNPTSTHCQTHNDVAIPKETLVSYIANQPILCKVNDVRDRRWLCLRSRSRNALRKHKGR
jgi:hypothetical protein